MGTALMRRTTAEKLRLFRRFFTGLKNVYGTYDLSSGRVRHVKALVTDQVMLDHLRGIQAYAVYLLFGNRTRAVVVDRDHADLELPIAFIQAARHYGIHAYIERSKGKGYHLWIFFDEFGVPARKARLVVRHILADIGNPDVEVFPKHDSLGPGVKYGNCINAPLFGRLVPHGRTAFMSEVDPTRPHPDQWAVLDGIAVVQENTLDEIIEINDLAMPPSQPPSRTGSCLILTERADGLPPCARRMLAEGVSDYQRVTCFRLSVHLKRMGLPLDVAVAVLRTWARKNRPPAGKRIITDPEILAQAKSAYGKDYRGCGCEEPAIAPYCSPGCRLYQKMQGRDTCA